MNQGQAQSPGRLPLSATLICRNEEACIGACLASLADCADIVVVDSGSTDRTLAIVEDFRARGFPVRLFQRDWPGYARQKQFALEQARENWVVSIDADEWLDDALRADLPRLLQASEVSGWRLPRVLTLYGETEPPPRAVKPDHILRLVRRERARFDETVLVHEGLVVEGEVRDAEKGLLRHERGLRLDAQLPKEILYARLKAEQRIAAGKKPSVVKLVFNPPMYFFRIFFARRVFLCGASGFVHAMTGAIYSFIAEALHFQMAREKRSGALQGQPRPVPSPRLRGEG